MSTTAITGYGGYLSNGGASAASYTRVAQVRKYNFSAVKAEFEDTTTLDSANVAGAVYKEWLKILLDGGSCKFDGVLNPADPTTQGLMANLQTAGNTALNYWKITLSSGSTMTFQGYVEEFTIGNEYNKAVPFTSSIKISGPITVAW